MAFSLLPMLYLCLAPPAEASVLSVGRMEHPDNVLRHDLRIRTSESARVGVFVWPADEGRAAGWTTDFTAGWATDTTVTLWGLRPDTRYSYQLIVQPEGGARYVSTERRTFRTDPLPETLPTVSVTTWGGAPDLDWLLFDARTADGTGALMITNPEGEVVWYQLAPNAGETLEAAWYDEENRAIYAIASHERVYRFGLDGAMTLGWEIGDPLSAFPHHEVSIVDGVVYVLTAREATVGLLDVVEDGIQAYDLDGSLLYEWWAAADGGLDPTVNTPWAWGSPGHGYWGSTMPGSIDWLHANSMQVREEDGAMKAYLSLRELWQVAKVDLASGEVEWLLGDNRTGARGASGDFAMRREGTSTRWWALQHHAHIEDDGLLYLFDNGDGTTRSRALGMRVDEESFSVLVEREVDFSELVGFGFDGSCDSQSSVFRTPADHLVMTCGPRRLVADYDATDTLQWVLEVEGSGGMYRATPIPSIGLD